VNAFLLEYFFGCDNMVSKGDGTFIKDGMFQQTEYEKIQFKQG
jgi:hypothetical protein